MTYQLHVDDVGEQLSRRAVLAGFVAVFGTNGCHAAGHMAVLGSLEAFGGRSIAGFDNGPALRRAGALGATVMLGAGIYEVDADALLRDDAIRLAPGFRLTGQGAARTELRVVGRGTINHLFEVYGAGDIAIRDVTITGNKVGTDTAPDAGGFLRAVLAPDATTDIADVLLADCVIQDFASSAWVLVVNQSAGHVIRRVVSRGCTWRSSVLPPGSDAIGVPGHFLYFYGAVGRIVAITIEDPLAQAAFMKGAVALRGAIEDAAVTIGRIENAGRQLTGRNSGPDGAGCYAVMGYATPAGAPRNLDITINVLADPVSVGVYLASVTDSHVEIGEAYGQRDTNDDTLPKGLLALNQCRRVTARIGRAIDNARVLEVSLPRLMPDEAGAEIVVHLDHVESRAGAIDVIVRAPPRGRSGGLVVTGARQGPAAVALAMMVDRRAELSNIDLSRFTGQGARQTLAVQLPERAPASVRLPLD